MKEVFFSSWIPAAWNQLRSEENPTFSAPAQIIFTVQFTNLQLQGMLGSQYPIQPLILPSKIYYSLISLIIYELQSLEEIPHFPAYVIAVWAILQHCHSLKAVWHPCTDLSKNWIPFSVTSHGRTVILAIQSGISVSGGLAVFFLGGLLQFMVILREQRSLLST